LSRRSRSYGAKGFRIVTIDSFVPTLDAAFRQRGVHLISIPIDHSKNVRVLVMSYWPATSRLNFNCGTRTEERNCNDPRALYHGDGHGFFRMLGKTANDMFVDVTIAVPDPETVDRDAVAKELPFGTVSVSTVKGGLEIPAEQGCDAIIIANAAVTVSLDKD
jgi:uncharacterized protein (TIGR02058 family)